MQATIKTAVGYIVTHLSKAGITAGGVVKIIVRMQRDMEILTKDFAHHGENSAP